MMQDEYRMAEEKFGRQRQGCCIGLHDAGIVVPRGKFSGKKMIVLKTDDMTGAFSHSAVAAPAPRRFPKRDRHIGAA